jgi:hypothetical protein
VADLGIRVVLDRPGRTPLDLSPLAETLRWATAAVGGFADAGFTLEGDRRRDLSVLGMVRISLETQLLWEGQVEDTVLRLGEDGFRTEVSCYGLRRRLEQTSTQRVYVKRDLSNWNNPKTVAAGQELFTGGGVSVLSAVDTDGTVYSLTGQYDVSDLTKYGVELFGGPAIGPGQGIAAEIILAGVGALSVLLGTVATGAPTTYHGVVGSSNGGASWTSSDVGTSTFSTSLAVGTDRLRVAAKNISGSAGAPGIVIEFNNMRLLGAITTEDASGGLYGGTILRDLISLIPDLTVGLIDGGSDFTINQLDRSIRDTALSVVEEVNGYYQSLEWGVWEDGRFDWVRRNLDEPQWLLTVADLAGLELTSSIDSLVKNVYLSYVEVPTFTSKEATAVSTDQRNPYVKNGKTKDVVVNVPFVMTTSTSQQLATVLARLQGGYIPASGTVTLPPTSQITNSVGTRKPACMIRGGDNIVISDLPKSDAFAPGRDGETLFHVAGCETNFEENKVTLTVESLDRRSDVLLARLAAATRTIGG